jgi:hypothetical protein
MSVTETVLAIGALGAVLPSAARASCVVPPRSANGVLRSTAPLAWASIDEVSPNTPVDLSGGERPAGERSIVGLWRVPFLVDGNVFDEAFDAWESGGTEILNDAQAPATGNVCLGVWKQTASHKYQVTHPGWNFDLNGTRTGSVVARERVTLARDGGTYTGTIALDFCDLSGLLIERVTGEVRAERVRVE